MSKQSKKNAKSEACGITKGRNKKASKRAGSKAWRAEKDRQMHGFWKPNHLARQKKARQKAKPSLVDFYHSEEWRSMRYKALKFHGRECQCCGAQPGNGVVLHVDHIKPRSLYPELELNLSNLQILCADCNLGKSNVDDTDFRPRKQELVWDDGLEQMKRDLETAQLRLEVMDEADSIADAKAKVQRLKSSLEKAVREREYPH